MRPKARSSLRVTLGGSVWPAQGEPWRASSSAHRAVVHAGIVVVVGGDVVSVGVDVVVVVVVASSDPDTTTNSLSEETCTTMSFAVRSQHGPLVQGPGVRSEQGFVIWLPSL